jgi:hypothetical protein
LEKAATRSILVDRPVLAGEVGNRTLFRQLTCDSARFFLIRFAEPGFGSKEVIYFKPREIPSIALNFEDIQETRAISNGALAREEVDSIFPLRLLQVGELAVSLVDQVRRSERVTTPLAHQVSPRQSVQLFIEERRQPIGCRRICAASCFGQLTY